MIRRGIGVQSFVSAGGGGTDADAQAFIDAAGITDATQQSAINTLVTDLKGYGIWSKMKAIYPMVGGTSSTHKWNLKDPRDLDAAFRLVFNGGGTHSSTGYLPNGTNGYADTFLLPSTQLTNNNSHLSFYSRTNIDIATGCDIGTSTGGSFIPIFALYSRASNVFRCNSYNYNAGSVLDITNNNSTGFYTNNRTSSTVLNGWKNGSKLGTATYTNTDNLTAIDKKIFISCLNLNGSAGQYSSREVAFASIGDGLTDTEAANLYTAVQAYQTSLSRNV